jgi:dihydrofolate reductase
MTFGRLPSLHCMAKTLYSVSMSLDGFIAGPAGDMSWLTDYIGPNPLVDDLLGDIGSLLVGNRTAGGDDPHRGTEKEGKAFGGGWEGPQFVLTRNTKPAPIPGINFVHDIRTAVAEAKAAAGDKYVNVMGATIARSCLEIGELDEVLTIVVPVMLGDGVRLFDHPGGTTVRLERVKVDEVPLATSLWFRVVK